MSESSLQVLLEPVEGPTWPALVPHLRTMLGAPNAPHLLPTHFLQQVFPRLGGRCILIHRGHALLAVGFLFPVAVADHRPSYLLRLHGVGAGVAEHAEQVVQEARKLLPGSDVIRYRPEAGLTCTKTVWRVDQVEVGHPDAREAAAIRDLQASIWGSQPDDLYPTDLHSDEFGSVLSLVTRLDGQLAGFLFGFRRLGGAAQADLWQGALHSELGLESQALGVLPAYRGRGVATALKRAQAMQALQQGMRIISWTADPLQFPNAVLNFGHLGAIAIEHHPDFYSFRNELNRITASRVGIAWLAGSRRVQQRTSTPTGTGIHPLQTLPEAVKVNDGYATWQPGLTAQTIAIEVPAQWTRLQAEAPDEAWQWRETSDALLRHYLGCQPGQYVITAAGQEGTRCYLLTQRVTQALVALLTDEPAGEPEEIRRG